MMQYRIGFRLQIAAVLLLSTLAAAVRIGDENDDRILRPSPFSALIQIHQGETSVWSSAIRFVGEMHWGLQVAFVAIVFAAVIWLISLCSVFRKLQYGRWTPRSYLKGNIPRPQSRLSLSGLDISVVIHRLHTSTFPANKLFRVRLEAGENKTNTAWTKGNWEEKVPLTIDASVSKLRVFLVKGAGFARVVVGSAKLDIKKDILDRKFADQIIVPLLHDGKQVAELAFSCSVQPKETESLPPG